ncbi:hypothetical protein Taro_034242, partial [Colocasia esculenta]|nr:hypothetical protein [Colocasia esculenta]
MLSPTLLFAFFQERKKRKTLAQSCARTKLWRLHSGDPRLHPARGNQGEGFPTTGVAPASTKNPEKWSFGGFLGQPKESFTKLLIPLECTQKASTLPIVFIQELGVNALTPSSRCASSDLAVHFWNGQRPPPSSSEQNSKLFCPSMWKNVHPWLREVGVAERRPVRTSRDMTSGRSSRPRHRQVLYFPHRHLWTMEYSCKVWCKPCRRRLIPRQYSRLSWRLRLVAFDHRTLDEALSAACRQEGEMEQYLEEKKASQKWPAATFQRQDKKKTVYLTPQRSVAVDNSQ